MPRAPFQVLVIPWRRGHEGLAVAIFRRADYNVWQFVSGGGEGSETPLEAARREGWEEARISPSASYLALETMTMLPACWFTAWSEWSSEILVIPEYAFAVECPAVVHSDEHHETEWCSVAAAMTALRFDSNRHALWELNERLYPGPRTKRFVYQ
jgi:dihydroneopterin triphosphate diphosphatase